MRSKGARHPARWSGATAMLVAMLAAGGGCAGGDGDGAAVADTVTAVTTTSSTVSAASAEVVLPDGLAVFVEYPRYLHARRRLEVAFDNDSDTAVRVTALALRSPLFEPLPAATHDTTVVPARRRDLQIDLGAARCPAAGGDSQVEMTIEIAGETHHGTVTVDAAPLERISAAECGQQFVDENVEITFGQEFTVDDGVLTTDVALARRATDERIVLDAVRGTVLLDLQPREPGRPLVVLEPGVDTGSTAVAVKVTRCDPHAVTESKKTFHFAMWVAIGDRDAQYVVVQPSGEVKARMEAMIDDCVLEYAG